MKLQQGQVWKLENHFVRIVALERLAVDYKLQADITSKDGEHVRSTKKAFCRLIKTGIPVNAPLGTLDENPIITTAIGLPYFEKEKSPLHIVSQTKRAPKRKR